ncbi:unnamed protein product [Cochlearia groenlandica]
MFQDSMPCVSSNSLWPVTKATFGSRDVQVFPLDQSQASFFYVEQGPLLLPMRYVGLKKPSLSKSLEKMSIKPASLDQGSEFSDQDSIEYESGSTHHHDQHQNPSSTWKEFQKILPQKHKEKKLLSRAITTTHKCEEGKRKEGGQLKPLVQVMMKHMKQSKKPKMAKGKGSFKLRNKVLKTKNLKRSSL